MKFTVKAIKKWKDDFIIIVESETGELLLATEDAVNYQVKPQNKVVGEIIDGIVHINGFDDKQIRKEVIYMGVEKIIASSMYGRFGDVTLKSTINRNNDER